VYRFALFLHVVAAVLFLGPLFAHPIVRSFRGQPPAAAVLKIEEAIARVHTLGVVVMGLTGLWLVFAVPDFDFGGATWLHLAILLYLVWGGVTTALTVPTLRRARLMADRGQGGDAAPLLTRLDTRLVPALGVLVVVLVFLMTYQPFE
jgi:uncharacterized membrane protein